MQQHSSIDVPHLARKDQQPPPKQPKRAHSQRRHLSSQLENYENKQEPNVYYSAAQSTRNKDGKRNKTLTNSVSEKSRKYLVMDSNYYAAEENKLEERAAHPYQNEYTDSNRFSLKNEVGNG